MDRIRLAHPCFAAATMLFALPCMAGQAPTYRITDLGALTPPWVEPGTETSSARAINNVGWVTGITGTSRYPSERAFSWRDGNMLLLEGLPGESFAYGINDFGWIVGTVGDEIANPYQAFLWYHGSMVRLGEPHPPGEGIYSTAYDVNNWGMVVGADAGRPVLWWLGLEMVLDALPGGLASGSARAVNDLGQVVGAVDSANGVRAVLWEHGEVIDLGDLPGGLSGSIAYDINLLGQVVGSSYVATGMHAFLWQRGKMLDLGDLSGGLDFSRANAINNRTQVVGYGYTADGTSATLWQPGFGLRDLNELIEPDDPLKPVTVLLEAEDINDRGQIVGSALIDGRQRAFLLTPVGQTRRH